MAWVAVAVVGSSLIGAGVSYLSSQNAASAQTQAANQSTQVQQAQNAEAQRQYDLSRADLAPYRNVGYSALSSLASSSGLRPLTAAAPAAGAPSANPWAVPAAPAAAPAAGAPGGQSPGYAAAMAAPPRSGGGNSPIQDIHQALQLGRPISDASWAQAGYGPGGSTPAWLAAQQQPQQASAAPAAAPADLPTVPLDQANPTIAPPGSGAAAPANEFNAPLAAEFNKPFTLADFQMDPGYAFRQEQGQRGVESSASARGLTLSGGTLKALDRYNQDYASGEYNNAFNRYESDLTGRYNRSQGDLTGRFNRLSSLAGTGQTATNETTFAGNNLTNQLQTGATNVQNNIAAAGNARSSAYVAGGNAVGNAAGSIGQYYALKSFLNPNGTGTGYLAPANSAAAAAGF